MSQYIVWLLIWFFICLMPVSYKKAKVGITEIKNNVSVVPGFLQSQRFVSINGLILFPVSIGIFWAILLGGWAIFQDFTFASWTGSILEFLSLSLMFLALGTVIRYMAVININGLDPEDLDLKGHLKSAGFRPLIVVGDYILQIYY